MNALTSGFAIASFDGYMNSGRESGLYEPSWTVSEVGATQPPPLSTCTSLSLSVLAS